MAKVKIVGNTVVVESEFTPEELKTVEKSDPEVLILYDARKEPDFVVTTKGCGCIGRRGVCFDGVGANGKACVAIPFDRGDASPEKWVEDNIGISVLKLNKVEDQVADVIRELTAKMNDLISNIQII